MFEKIWSRLPTRSAEPMREVVPCVVLPDDVGALLSRRDELNSVGLGIDLRSPESSVEYTEAMWQDPLLRRLGFITLGQRFEPVWRAHARSRSRDGATRLP
jgi:hypothetical protein